ncbi:MAG: thioredoxin domain-containing protein [Methanomicrobiales archaeon]|jgi:protein-disulfide isomerase
MAKPPKNDLKNSPSQVFAKKGVIAGLILVAAIIFLAAIVIATGNMGASPAVPPQACGGTVLTFVNANLAQAGSTATLVNVTEKSGIYEINVQYLGRDIPLFATKDCTLLFPNSLALTGTQPTAAQPQATAAPVASASPVVDLYVMAFCPYGTQAEAAMQPVANLLGTKANITVRYIVSVQGTTAASVSSLHGPSEAMEDLRQLCINRDYPQQLWPYLTAYDRDCYPNWQNATQLDACRAKTMQALGIDAQGVETCANSPGALALLSADETLSNTNNVQASPTVIINGEVYNGERTPDAYKQAICAHFATAPAECSVNLSTTGTAATGGCG